MKRNGATTEGGEVRNDMRKCEKIVTVSMHENAIRKIIIL